MTTETNNQNNENTGPVTNVQLTKPNAVLDIASSPVPAAPAAETVSVNIGVFGNMQKVLVDANSNVGDVVNAASINASGYQFRMNGAPAALDTRLPAGVSSLTILLLKPVKGNRSWNRLIRLLVRGW